MSLSQDIKLKTIELGFDLVGVTDASPIDAKQAEVLAGWLKSGFAGQMDYMRRNLQKRLDPTKLLEHARSIIVVGLNYTPPRQKSKSAEHAGAAGRAQASRAQPRDLPIAPTGRVAHYAQYEDYHSFMKERLHQLADYISSLCRGSFNFKICVDSAPLAERALAVRAGLGFIGRNHMVINPQLGCEIFLGELITDLELQPDEPVAAGCTDCTRCIDACPTGALGPDGQFDAGRCINYLTIEYKGSIPPELAEKIDDRLFGCDECVLACPYQKDAPPCRNKQFRFYPERAELNLHEILSLTAESFEARFAGSPIKRAGLDGLKRNARICLANSTRHP
jgi:epoxyqueuosine reductase